MKKYLYSFAMILAGLTSCTDFDGPVTEHYGPAPTIEVTITPGEQTDNEFTINIKPDASALYYAFAIGRSAEPQALDSATLYKGGYGNDVVKVAAQPDTTITITTAAPNTTYQVYAVAGSKEGIISSVVVKSITTTDAGTPVPGQWSQGAEEKAVAILFSENVTRGDGAVKALYYKEWDWDHTVDLTADDIVVTVDGQIAQFSVPNAPAGAIVLFSWEEGAFVDAMGNKCPAFTTVYDEDKDDFVGYWVQVQKVAFDIADSYVTPVSGTPIGAWTDFEGTITFPYNIYRIDDDVKKGDIQVVYTNGDRQVAYNLTPNQWEVDGDQLFFGLPTEPTVGDQIQFTIKEGIVFDVYGNPNAEYVSTNIMLTYAGFIATKDMVLGEFNYYASIENQWYNLGTFSIEENAEVENGLILKDFYLQGAAVPATMDLANNRFFVAHLAEVGVEEDEGTPYTIYTYDTSGNKNAPVTINADGTLTSDALVLVGTPDGQSLYYWIPADQTVFQRPAAGGVKADKRMWKKGAKLNVTLSSLRK